MFVRKTFFLFVFYSTILVGFISITFKRPNQPHTSTVIPSSIRTYQTTNVSYDYEDKCGDGSSSSRQSLWNVIHNDEIFNYVAFVLRSHSLLYCSVPKVATRTLLLFLTYLHIRDDLIPLMTNNSRTDLLNIPYFNQIISSSIKNTSNPVSLLQLFLSQFLLTNSSKIGLWSMYQNKIFPFIRPRTLSDPSVLYSSKSLRVIFVRHPLERLASAYIDKITSLNNTPLTLYDNLRRAICRKYSFFYLTKEQRPFYRIRRSLVKQMDEPCAKIIPNFEHFIDYLMSDSLKYDVHWRPYSSLCHACLFKYNFIGKFETIEEDLPRLLKSLGLTSSHWMKKDNPFKTGKTKDNYKLMYSNLNQKLICYLKEFYRDDFKLFHYRIEEYFIQNTTMQCTSRHFRNKFLRKKM